MIYFHCNYFLNWSLLVDLSRTCLDSYEDNHKFVCLDDTFNATPYFLMNLLVGVRWACIHNVIILVFFSFWDSYEDDLTFAISKKTYTTTSDF